MRLISRTFPAAAFALSPLLAADPKQDIILIDADDPSMGMQGWKLTLELGASRFSFK